MSVGRLSSEARKRGAIGVLAYALPAYTQPETHRTSIQFSSIQADTDAKAWGILLSYDAREALAARARQRPGSRARDDAIALLGVTWSAR